MPDASEKVIQPTKGSTRGRPRRHRGIADRLAEAIGEVQRADPGLSQRAIADRAGISEQALRGLLRGVDPRCSTVAALASALGVPPGWLAFGR
jgi:lambda repressor-like predicted transcriptional regulator